MFKFFGSFVSRYIHHYHDEEFQRGVEYASSELLFALPDLDALRACIAYLVDSMYNTPLSSFDKGVFHAINQAESLHKMCKHTFECDK